MLRSLRLPKKMGILTSNRQPKSKNSDENTRFWFDLKHLIYNRCKISYNIIFKFGRIFAIEYALMLQETILCEFGHTIPSFITGCFERAIWRENLKAIDTFLFFAPGFTQQVQDSGVTQQERAEKWPWKTSTWRVCPRRRPTSRLVHILLYNLAGLSELGSSSKALQWAQQSYMSNPPIPRSARELNQIRL